MQVAQKVAIAGCPTRRLAKGELKKYTDCEEAEESQRLSNCRMLREKLLKDAARAKEEQLRQDAALAKKEKLRAAAEKAKQSNCKVSTKSATAAKKPMTEEELQAREEKDRRQRGAEAWAKSCSGSELKVEKDSSYKVQKKEKNAYGFEVASTCASESDDKSRRDEIILYLFLSDMKEKDLRKKLRTLHEIRVAEQTIADAEKQGKKTHPNLHVKVGRKASLCADPLVQRFRQAGGKI